MRPIHFFSLLVMGTIVCAQEPNEQIVKQTERQVLYLQTLEKMFAVAKPVRRIDADASRVHVTLDPGASGFRGQLTPFWRTNVMPDRWLALPGWGVPSKDPVVALLERETGRTLSRYAQTSLLDDTISCVRLLGGWKSSSRTSGEVRAGVPIAQYDLVYRTDDGNLAFRWDLLHGRIGPVVDNGLTPLIVLDNVPYCLSDGSGEAVYGQHLAPNDFEAWGRFIEELCRELADRYGLERVNTWRFRVGTEMDNPNHWEGGADDSLVKYLKTYDFAAAAVKRVLPGAKIGPCNFNSMFAGQLDRKVPPMAVFEHLASGTNYATGTVGSPVDFVSVSSYGMYWMGGKFDHPNAAAHGYSPDVLRLHADLLKRLRATSPRFADIPLEIHEHGTLFNEQMENSCEPGAFGAAWTATQYIVGIDEGLSRIFHWREQDRVAGKRILYSHAWLRVLFEKMAGGEAWVPEVAHANDGVFLNLLAVRKEDKLYLLLSGYRPERKNHVEESFQIHLPVEFKAAQVRYLQFNRQTAPFDVMAQDLKVAGELKGAVNSVPAMATKKGTELLNQNASKYLALQDESFQWKDGSGLQVDKDLNIKIPVPSVTFFEVVGHE